MALWRSTNVLLLLLLLLYSLEILRCVALHILNASDQYIAMLHTSIGIGIVTGYWYC